MAVLFLKLRSSSLVTGVWLACCKAEASNQRIKLLDSGICLSVTDELEETRTVQPEAAVIFQFGPMLVSVVKLSSIWLPETPFMVMLA